MQKVALTFLKFAVSVILLFAAMRGVNLASVGDRIRVLDPVWATTAIAAIFAQLLIGAFRWRDITLAVGGRLSVRDAFRFYLIGSFFAQALPSTLGGDGMRLLLLQQTGVGWTRATYSVLVDRAVGFIVLAVIVVISLPWSYGLIANEQGRMALMAISTVAAVGSLAFMALGLLKWAWIGRFFAVRHIHACAQETIKVLFRPTLGPKIQFMSLANHILTIFIAWCVAQAVLVPLSFLHATLLIPLVVLIMTVPISIAGWGVREQSMQLGFVYAGLNGADGLVISLLFGLAYLVVGLVGGAVWLLDGERRRQDSPPSSAAQG